MIVWSRARRAAFAYVPTMYEARLHKARACHLLAAFQACCATAAEAPVPAPAAAEAPAPARANEDDEGVTETRAAEADAPAAPTEASVPAAPVDTPGINLDVDT